MGRALLSIIMILLFGIVSKSAFAACVNPTGNSGDIILNTGEYVFQGCTGSEWVAFHEKSPLVNMLLCDNPKGKVGDIVYNQNVGVFQGCTNDNFWMAFHNATEEDANFIGYWPLDERTGTTISDVTASDNDGTLYGTTADAATTSGIFNRGLEFDGVDDYIDFGNKPIFDSPEGTYNIWVKTDGSWDTDGAGSGDMALLFARSGTTGSANGFTVLIRDNSSLHIQVKSPGGDAGGNVINFPPFVPTTILDNQWHMVTFVYTQTLGEDNVVYFDGVESRRFKNNNTWMFGAYPLRIADSGDPYWEEFKGSLDDFRFYDRILTPAEIETLYSCSGPNEKRGSIVYNSDEYTFQGCTSTGWIAFHSKPKAVGGIVSRYTDGDGNVWTVHTFMEDGVFALNEDMTVDTLIVGGGGGGGTRSGGGGGGGGGIVERRASDGNALSLSAGDYPVTVGAGGSGGVAATWWGISPAMNGEDSTFSGLTALGGGNGGATFAGHTRNAGGAGGGGENGASPGAGLQPASADGGFGYDGGAGQYTNSGGGGGGAGGAGQNSTAADGGTGGNGGVGRMSNITGTAISYAGGGGGSGLINGAGGSGGGGQGNGSDGVNGLGGGGGGVRATNIGGDGGSGVVIISYISKAAP